jgi:uncharacterized protein YndB with AHSA1/START domain
VRLQNQAEYFRLRWAISAAFCGALSTRCFSSGLPSTGIVIVSLILRRQTAGPVQLHHKTTIMLPKEAVVQVSQLFPFRAEDIFDAWANPSIVPRWMFSGDNSEITAVDIDFRVGGQFAIKERDRNSDVVIDHFGKYVEIDSPFHLAFSLEVPLRFTGITYVSVFIVQEQNGSLLTLTQTGVSPEKTESGWYRMLRQLQNVLADARPL